MQMRDIPVPTLVLGVVAVWSALVLMAALSGLAGRFSLHPDDPGSVPAVPQLDLSQARTDLPAMDHYAEVGQRPLFNADRRPLPPDEVAEDGAEPAAPPSPLEVTLTSVIISGDVQLAILQDNRNQKTLSVRVGNFLEGDQSAWKLVELGPRRAVFEGPGGRAEADLRVFDGSGAQAPTALTAQPVGAASAAVADRGQVVQGEEASVAVATETPESRAELIRRRIEERRRQMREAAARSSEPSKE